MPLPSTDGTGTKWPAETASRPLSLLIVPAQPVCPASFALFRSLHSEDGSCNAASLCLLDIELRLIRIGDARASGDFDAMALQSGIVAGLAENLGALQAAYSARQLELACRVGKRKANHLLVNRLIRACMDAEAVVRRWLSAAVD